MHTVSLYQIITQLQIQTKNVKPGLKQNHPTLQ